MSAKLSILSKKILAHDVVTMRGARGGKDAPLIVSIPKEVAEAAKCNIGEKWQIFTDGERLYFERLVEPKI